MSNFKWAVENVLHHEGGFNDIVGDSGGATNWGISLRFLQNAGDLDGDGLPDGDLDGDGDVDIDDIRNASRAEAVKLYRDHFWKPNKCDAILSGLLSNKIFDMAVNMGSKQAWKIVQRSINKLGGDLVVDGIVGINTIAAVNSLLAKDFELVTVIRERQGNFYETLIERKPILAKFRLGWRRRAAF